MNALLAHSSNQLLDVQDHEAMNRVSEKQPHLFVGAHLAP